MLEKILSALDLGVEERKIYRHLLNEGETTAGELARKIGMARPTLYDLLRKMRDKGVVGQSMRHGVRSYEAEAPYKLNHMLDTKIKTLQEQQTQFQNLLPLLEARRNKQFLAPRYHFFDGVDGLKNVIMDMLLYRDLTTYAFWSIKAAMTLLTPDFFCFHNTERIRNRLLTSGAIPFWAAAKVFTARFASPRQRLTRIWGIGSMATKSRFFPRRANVTDGSSKAPNAPR